ncbi:3-hydroxyacyl-CoA dehydrogenase NAD-binding domain-containing protein [Pseudomonas sp. NPDC089401]|uniref:3-hydroxyacyl-CoA dehydrogenase NAD-binding domain-containing protein n=1 Tax=Pseudomonas sp. NPDC089401 TaxID=3364462 RepID=UPI0038299B9F
MSALVEIEIQANLAFIRVSNPPVNALSHAVRAALLEAFRQVEADARVQAVVLLCEGRTFMAGADIKEFGLPAQAPALPHVVNAIEASAKPSVAVLQGTALGGGLEVAMACHYRIAQADARVGLPEVKLGLLPGAGGTQRLPRLVGVAKALDMIVGGAPISAQDALAHGLVDALCEGDLAAAGQAFAEQLLAQGKGVRRTGERRVADAEAAAGLIEAKRVQVRQASPALFAPLRCVAAIEAAVALDLSEGLARERDLFGECLASPQRAALVHAFFAERKAAKVADLPADTVARPVRHAAVIGGGTMGVGIALCFANAGVPVRLLEVDIAARDRALQRARDTYCASVKRGSLTAEAMEKRLRLIEGVIDYQALADVDLVIEAVFEDLAVKRQVFERLDAVCKPGAILATNTSSLNLDTLASFTRRPQDVVGLHFFSPANVMRLLEVVRGEQTAFEVLASALALGKTLNKSCVVVGVCDGFVGNRMLFQYGRETEFLLEEGATPEQVDAALRGFGMAMGPMAMRDLAGLDIGRAIRQRQRKALDARYPMPRVLDKLCDAGMLGQKTGRGYYLYQDGSRTPQANPQLLALLEEASREQGLTRQALSDDYIVERALLALINEGAKILEEGIAQRASDIDLIYLHGYGFPAHHGGPMFYAERLGLGRVLERIQAFQARFGAWWTPAPLLERLVASGKTFSDWEVAR